MATYATLADLQASHIVYNRQNTRAALEALLVRAEQDIDQYLGGPIPPDGKTKFAPEFLSAGQRNALRRATLAQAELRLELGDVWFSVDQHSYSAGPDFSHRGTLSRISPGAVAALAGSGLVTRWGTVSPLL